MGRCWFWRHDWVELRNSIRRMKWRHCQRCQKREAGFYWADDSKTFWEKAT